MQEGAGKCMLSLPLYAMCLLCGNLPLMDAASPQCSCANGRGRAASSWICAPVWYCACRSPLIQWGSDPQWPAWRTSTAILRDDSNCTTVISKWGMSNDFFKEKFYELDFISLVNGVRGYIEASRWWSCATDKCSFSHCLANLFHLGCLFSGLPCLLHYFATKGFIVNCQCFHESSMRHL